MKSSMIQAWRFMRYVIVRLIQDDFSYRAAALTFTSLLSLVPIFVVAVTVLSAFPVFSQFGEVVQQFIIQNFVPEFSKAIHEYLQGFLAHSTQLSAVGFVFLIITSVLMLFTMEQAFNAIWRVKSRRRGVSVFMTYWAILTLSPVLVGLSLVVSSYVVSLPLVTDAAKVLGIYELVLSLVPLVLTTFAFTLLYVAVPNCRVKLRHGLIGGIVATLLFELAKHGFAFYITSFPTYKLLYGAIAVVPLFLIWVYLSWLIILFGSLLTYALTYHRSIRSGISLQAFNHVIYWLERMWLAQQAGKILDLPKLVTADRVHYEVNPEQVLEHLIKNKVVARTREGYVLMQDLTQLTVANLYQILPWKLSEADNLEQSQCLELNGYKSRLAAANQCITQNLDIPITALFKNA